MQSTFLSACQLFYGVWCKKAKVVFHLRTFRGLLVCSLPSVSASFLLPSKCCSIHKPPVVEIPVGPEKSPLRLTRRSSLWVRDNCGNWVPLLCKKTSFAILQMCTFFYQEKWTTRRSWRNSTGNNRCLPSLKQVGESKTLAILIPSGQ